MVTRLIPTAALAVAFAASVFVAPAFATGNSTRDLTPSHGITCAQGLQDMEREIKSAAVRGLQQQQAQQGIDEARQVCESGDQAAAEQKLAGVRQLLAGE